MKRLLLILLCLMLASGNVFSQQFSIESAFKFTPINYDNYAYRLNDGNQVQEKPTLRKGIVIGQLAGGAVAGLITGAISTLFVPCYDLDCLHPFVIGYAFGASNAIYTIGSIGNQTGSYSATIRGGMGIVLGSYILIFAVNAPRDDFDFWDVIHAWSFVTCTLSTITSVIVFNKTRRYKSDTISFYSTESLSGNMHFVKVSVTI